MFPFWLHALLALLPPAAVGGILLKAFWRSADKRDAKFDQINDSIQELVSKVGAQNGRIGKLEERHRLEDTGWSRRNP